MQFFSSLRKCSLTISSNKSRIAFQIHAPTIKRPRTPLPYTSPFVFPLAENNYSFKLPLLIPFIYINHLKYRKHYNITKLRNIYTVISTESDLVCILLHEVPIENISAHTETLCRRLESAAFHYRDPHAMKRGLGFQDLI